MQNGFTNTMAPVLSDSMTNLGPQTDSGRSKYDCSHILLITTDIAQSTLPVNGYPLCWILYADKSKLSSFGTVKGYPVIIRCANLPSNIRNGTGIGGGRVVGWLPVVHKQKSLHMFTYLYFTFTGKRRECAQREENIQ